MQAIEAHTGRMAPLRRNDVDTDQIIPSDFCRRLTKTGFEDGLFAGWRADPGFVLNRTPYASATVLVAQRNFGSGSSRETAVWALRDWGFAAVIAESFGDIFQRNAGKNALLAVTLGADAVGALLDHATERPDTEITVDLLDRQVRSEVGVWDFAIEDRARWLMLNGLDEIAVTLGRDAAIRAHEAARPPWLPRTAAPTRAVPVP